MIKVDNLDNFKLQDDHRENPNLMSLQDYIENEESVTDLFLFMKNVCPKKYAEFDKRVSSDVRPEAHSANLLLEKKKSNRFK